MRAGQRRATQKPGPLLPPSHPLPGKERVRAHPPGQENDGAQRCGDRFGRRDWRTPSDARSRHDLYLPAVSSARARSWDSMRIASPSQYQCRDVDTPTEAVFEAVKPASDSPILVAHVQVPPGLSHEAGEGDHAEQLLRPR